MRLLGTTTQPGVDSQDRRLLDTATAAAAASTTITTTKHQVPGPSDSLPGLCYCFWIPLGDFRPRDSFASHHLTSNPEYAPELGAAFSIPAFSTPAILMVPRFPLPRSQPTR